MKVHLNNFVSILFRDRKPTSVYYMTGGRNAPSLLELIQETRIALHIAGWLVDITKPRVNEDDDDCYSDYISEIKILN